MGVHDDELEDFDMFAADGTDDGLDDQVKAQVAAQKAECAAVAALPSGGEPGSSLKPRRPLVAHPSDTSTADTEAMETMTQYVSIADGIHEGADGGSASRIDPPGA